MQPSQMASYRHWLHSRRAAWPITGGREWCAHPSTPRCSVHSRRPADDHGPVFEQHVHNSALYSVTGSSSYTTSSSRHTSSTVQTVSRRCALAAAMCLPATLPLIASAGQIVDESICQSVFESCSPSVVAIVDFKTKKSGAEAFEPLGSGVVFDGYGHVVTNYHVISKYVLDRTGAEGIKVVLQGADGSSLALPAFILGTDAMKDLAVLAISGDVPSELQPLPVASSGDLKVGQSVYALGARYGEGKSMSAGVVSGLQRAIPAPTGTRIYGVIQTDASINAVNSGGALVNSFGQLVGLNTAIFTNKSTGRGSGVSFALPSDMLREVVPNLVVYGSASGRGVRGATPS